jgi:transposase
MKSCLIGQASGIIRGCFEHKLKTISKINYCKSNNLSTIKLEKELDNIKIKKPILNKDTFSIELNSTNTDFKDCNKQFNSFLRLKCLSDNIKHIKIPIKLNKIDRKWLSFKDSKRLNSISLSRSFINIRYQLDDLSKKIACNKAKANKRIIGIDTGYNSVVTCSKGSIKTVNNHNQTFDSICKKLNRKNKASKAYKRAQDHRTNFINWSVKQINLTNIDQINLEKVNNIFYKKNTSNNLKRWVHKEIEKKILGYAEEHGVHVNLQSSAYYSQRCSNCGYVYDKNRKSKQFNCKKCNFKIDADLNSSLNHEIELCKIPYFISIEKLNRSTGFYWKTEGIFDLDGQEITVPVDIKKNKQQGYSN